MYEHVSAGPWRANGEDDIEEEVWADNGHPGGSLIAKCGDFDDSLWIATMSPSVAGPIASLLRAHAEHCRVAVAQMETIRRGAPDVMVTDHDLVTPEGRAALALARAILGETGQEVHRG